MKIVVCIKQVPARDSVLRLNSAATWVQDTDLSFELNEPDIYALEEGLRLKEKHGGEVVLATLGPARAQQTIKEALAKGADRALHLDDPAFANLDAFGIARALGKAIEKEKPDIILTGLQSDDFGAAQTGVVLAEFLTLPHSTIIMEIQVEGGALRVKRELEGGWFQWITLPIARRADHSIRHQQAPICHAERHHGGKEEARGETDGGGPGPHRRGPRPAPAHCQSLYPRESRPHGVFARQSERNCHAPRR